MGSVRRRQLMGGKPKPKDIVTVFTKTINVGWSGNNFSEYVNYDFKKGADYTIKATTNARTGGGFGAILPGTENTDFVITRGEKSAWADSLSYDATFLKTPSVTSRIRLTISMCKVGTIELTITETIHPN